MSDYNQDNFQDVLTRINYILESEYDSDLHRSSLTAFNKLKTREKRTLLRGFLSSTPETSNTTEPDLVDVLTSNDTQQETLDIVAYNQKELIDLKTWIAKLVAVAILVAIVLIIVASFIFSDSMVGEHFLGGAGQQLKLFFSL